MKICFSFCLLLFVFFSCNQNANCYVEGFVCSNDGKPMDHVEIGVMDKISPRDFVFDPIREITLNNGHFHHTIRKKRSEEDRNYMLYFKKEGFERVVRVFDILEHQKIHLDTIFLSPLD